jgi:hypothetical protein
MVKKRIWCSGINKNNIIDIVDEATTTYISQAIIFHNKYQASSIIWTYCTICQYTLQEKYMYGIYGPHM